MDTPVLHQYLWNENKKENQVEAFYLYQILKKHGIIIKLVEPVQVMEVFIVLTSVFSVAIQIGPLSIRWYGIINCLAMLAAIFVAYREAKREHLNPDHLLNLALLIIPLGVIGARIYFVVMHWSYYAQHIGEIVQIWKGGLAIHGGILLGLLTILWYCRHKKLSFLRGADLIVLGVILAQAIGRWGNYVNAELYGPVIEAGSPWSWIPFQVYADGAYHHPTFLYESVWDLLGFFFLLSLIRRLHRIGMIFSIYLMFTSFGRFFIEIIRMDMLMLFGVRQCYITCPLMFLTGAILSILIRHRPKVDVTAIPKVGEPRLGRDYYKYKNKK